MTLEPPIDDPAELTLFIEQNYHATHREKLPDLAALALRVERVHAGEPTVPVGLSSLLEEMMAELESHMQKEERILFPAIRQGITNIAAPIAVMRADHQDHGDRVARIRALTNDLNLPEGACRSWTSLYAGLGEFMADLAEHIRLEDDILFPRYEPA